jgi:hypothetical protein
VPPTIGSAKNAANDAKRAPFFHAERIKARAARHTRRFVDDNPTAAGLFAELQAELSECGLRSIPSDDGSFEQSTYRRSPPGG